jgi:hypothetical protein
MLSRVDAFIATQGFKSIDDIALSIVFESLWLDQLVNPPEGEGLLPQKCVVRQMQTRAFWCRLRDEFGVPHLVPPVTPYVKPTPTEFADSREQIIPGYVIKQLANCMGLHREGVKPLGRVDHLRLCVLLLGICLGRRFEEVLSAPRGDGEEGPMKRYPSQDGPPEGSLWFEFMPNKKGPKDKVLISREWEDLAGYCVRELAAYSDEVRHLASPEERGLLILVSPLNWTWGSYARLWPAGFGVGTIPEGAKVKFRGEDAAAFGLGYSGFVSWMNGTKIRKGIFELLGITADGSDEGPPYRLETKFMRHTRHSALALDPDISLSARQNDLNHLNRNMQFAYQHRLTENNDLLLEKIKEGKLVGRGVEWLCEMLGINLGKTVAISRFTPGTPSVMTPEWRARIRNSPAFYRLNRVPKGLCIQPQGPAGCAEFMNCTTATEGGCHCFVVDADDELMLLELDVAADDDRRLERVNSDAGRKVAAGRYEVLARRTEELRDEAMRHASEETLKKLRRIKEQMESEDNGSKDDKRG